MPPVTDDLSALSDEDLEALEAEQVSEFDRLRDEGADLAVLAELAEGIDAVRAEAAARAEAAERRSQEVSALDARVHGAEEDSTTDPEVEDPDAAPGPDEDEDQEPETQDEPQAVAASARRPSTAAVARRAPRPKAEPPAVVVITAAADVPGLSTGQRVDGLQLSQGMHDRARGLNDGSPRVSVARVDQGLTHVLTDDPSHNLQVTQDLIGQPNAAALVASGGWCAPSTPIFTFFDIGDASGLIDLPTLRAVRGGVLVPSWYGFGDVDGALWNWTEAMDIDAADGSVTKPCLKIPCPTWTECRLEAEGLCVTHGNLADRAFPELTRHFLNVVMNAHAHRVSASKMSKIVSDATAVVPDASMLTSDAAGDLLGVIALAAADVRSQYRAGTGRSVDVLLPDWTIEMLRADVAKRAGVDLLSVTDAQVVGWLTSRNVRPQFLSDYQPLYGTAPATRWPASIEVTAFVTGAYVVADGGSIDLGVVRDSTLNATNDFTAAWSEQFFCVTQVGPNARKYVVPINVDGVTGCCDTAAA